MLENTKPLPIPKKKIIPRRKNAITSVDSLPTFAFSESTISSVFSSKNDSDSEISEGSNEYHQEDNSIDLSVPHVSRETIEKIAGRKVNNLSYYRQSLVHKSVQGLVKRTSYEVQPYMKKSNERLEFLGDSWFGAVVTLYLFNKYPNKDEGFLTKIRTRIVKGTAMATFAEKIGIKDNILMSKYVENNGGKNNKRFLEDAFEAFVGAIVLDLGTEAVHDFVLKIIQNYVNETEILKDDNYKDLLLRFSQFKRIEAPIYECIKKEGPPHKCEFTIQVKMYENVYGTGKGKTKKKAEQIAARQAIEKLGITEEVFKQSRDL